MRRLRLPRAMGRMLPMLALVTAAGCAGDAADGRHILNTGSRLRVAEVAEASGQTDVALAMYAASAANDPSGSVQVRYVAALGRSGNTAQAHEVLTRALERQPDDPRLLLEGGRLRLRSGTADEALRFFDRILARDSRHAGALGGRGVALDLRGDHAAAVASHQAAVAVAPNDIALQNNLAFSLLLAGRAREAATILEAASQRPDAPPRVHVNLALARAASGDSATARTMLQGRVPVEELAMIVANLSR